MKFLKIQDELSYLNQSYNVQRDIEDVFIKAGYTMIEPSFFEDYDDFIDINKRLKKESMIKVLNNNGNILILRPDITTGIIKKLIPRWEENLKLKLFYNSTIFKNKTNAVINEDKQIGIEYLGEDLFSADCEVISLSLKILKQYNKKFILEIGTSKYINGLILGLNLEEKLEKDLKILIYNKNYCELDLLIESLNLDNEIKKLFKNILDFQGSFNEVIENANNYYTNESMRSSLKELKALKEFLELNCELDNIYFDLSMIADFDYYEGIIFKGYYPDVYQPILNGGRYDYLTERVGKKVSAVGFSININELMKSLNKEDV